MFGVDGAPLLVALVDERSASAAEIFAAALYHSGRAVVLGRRTFGKGTSQALVYQSDGGALSFTVYTLAVGAGSQSRVPLNDGVEPHVRWGCRAPAAMPSAENRELARAVAMAQRWVRSGGRSWVALSA